MKKNRPEGVPSEARWSETSKEWEIGETNAQGISTGVWKWWREDGSLCCETHYKGETGRDFIFSRFHQDGTFSWKGERKQGQNHGVHDFQKSENPTTESVNKQSEQFGSKVYSWRSFFDMGKSTRSSVFFDKNGNEVSIKGVKKPDNLPEEASAVLDGTWRLELKSDGVLEKFKGILYDWDEMGRVYKKSTYDLNPVKKKKVEFYDIKGNVYCERNFETCKGYVLKPQNEVISDPHVHEHFKGKTVKITYDFTHSHKLDDEVYLPSNNRYFDINDKQLTSAGEELVKPSENARMILESTYQGSEIYFYEATFDDFDNKDGLLTIWSGNGIKKYEAEFSQNLQSKLKTFNEDGALKTEEIFELGKLTADNNPMLKRFKIFMGEITREFFYDKDGYNSIQNIYKNSQLVETIDNDNIKEDLTIGTFIKEFDKRYKDMDSFSYIAFNGYFYVQSNGVNDNPQNLYFKRSIFAGDGSGNELFIILEPGEHFGKIYDNDHETGLYTVEDSDCIEYFINDELGIDLEDVENMDKNELIKLLPFYVNETKVAENLNELIKSVYISSKDTYRTRIKDLLKIIIENKK